MDDLIFSSDLLYSNLDILKDLYPFLEIGSAGTSVMGKNIPYIRLGRGNKEVFYSASYHANEWITSLVLLEFLYDFCNAYKNNLNIFGYSARNIFNTTSIYIMPLVNPDGVDLVTGALPRTSIAYRQATRIANNFPDVPFPEGWKANISGVDLNTYQPLLNY